MQQRSEETRAGLLAAALKCFSQKGYEASSVADICNEAGVSKGAFYHHFPSKQSLFLALLDAWLATLDEALLPGVSDSTQPSAVLMRMASLSSVIFREADGRLPMFLEFWIQASRDPEVWKTTIAPYRRYADIFAELLNKGIEDGSMQIGDVNIAARVLVALAVGLLLQAQMDPQGAEWDVALQEGVRLLLRGMEAKG